MNDCGHQPIIDQLQTRITNLEAALQAALARIAELEPLQSSPPPAHFVPKPNQRQPRSQRRKRDPQHNHARRRSVLAGATIDHAFDCCPTCGYHLQGNTVSYVRELIDLPAPQPVVHQLHRFITRHCPGCDQDYTPKATKVLANQLCGRSRFGNQLRTLVGFLTTRLRLPIDQVRLYLQELYDLKLSAGAVVGLQGQLAKAGQATLKQLMQQLVQSSVLHMDETTMREDGVQGWLWQMSNAAGLHYYYWHAAQGQPVAGDDLPAQALRVGSRGGAIVKRLLAGFKGVLVTDWLGSYNIYAGLHQRCWVHLLRDLHRLKEKYPAAAPLAAQAEQLYQWYKQGKQSAAHDPPLLRRKVAAGLEAAVAGLARQEVKDKASVLHGIWQRLLRHGGELFTYVWHEGVSADNNLAERGIRHLAVARKVKGGTRSGRGSQVLAALHSLFSSWAGQGQPLLASCLAMLRAANLTNCSP